MYLNYVLMDDFFSKNTELKSRLTSPHTSTALLFISLSVFFTNFFGKIEKIFRIYTLFIAFHLIWYVFIGYLVGFSAFYSVNTESSIGMAPLTFIALVSLLAASYTANLKYNYIHEVLSSKFTGSIVCRNVLLLALAIPFTTFFIKDANYLLFLDTDVKNSLTILISILCICISSLAIYFGYMANRTELKLVRELEKKEELNKRLTSSYEEIEELRSGLVTVCAWSNRIKQGDDEWIDLEKFLNESFGIKVSHGMSPEEFENQKSRLKHLADSLNRKY